MKRKIGICSKCGGGVFLHRNGHPGICEDCGAIQKIKLPEPNYPKLEMEDVVLKKQLLQE